MKNYNLLFTMFLAIVLFSCNNSSNNAESEKDAKTGSEAAKTYTLDNTKSSLKWKGSKPASFHEGTIALKSGELKVENNQISAGSFEIDMTKIVNTDLTDATYNQKLIGHLSSEDFFNVAKFPTAKFVVTAIETKDGKTMASGNLTIKDITKNISFPIVVNITETEVKVTAQTFTIDRTEWEIKYNSGKFFEDLKDKLISDEIEFSFELVAKI